VHSDFDELRERSQQNLITFLGIELDLALAFTQTAKIKARMQNFGHSERSREFAGRALDAVQRFQARIVDSEARREIRERAIEVKKGVSSLWP
jgi:hypothetical protein